MATFYLIQAERELFDALPGDLTATWKDAVEDETIDAFETPEQLHVRMRLAVSNGHPEVRTIAEEVLGKMERGEELDPNLLDMISHESMSTFFFALGTRGLSALIELALREATSEEDLESLAALSKTRHLLLEANASVSI